MTIRTRTDALAPRRCYCPSCTIATAVYLLETGRPRMALQVLKPLAEAMADTLCGAPADEPEPPSPPNRQDIAPIGAMSWERPPKGGKPGFIRVAAEIRGHVARLGPERTCELLRIRRRDLDELLEGRMDVEKAAMARLRKAEE